MKPESLILIPGLMCDEQLWRAQINHFSPRLTIQVADHGELDSLPAMAERVLATAPNTFALAGHSMGGRVALEVMRLVLQRSPQRVTHLGLFDTGCHALPSGAAEQKERAARQAFVDQVGSEGVPAMSRTWLKGMIHPSRFNDDQLIGDIVAMFSRKSAAVFRAQVRALLNRPEAYPLLNQVQCPTLVLCGNEDSNSPPAANREMHAALPNAELNIIEECGHMSMMERPEEVSAAMEKWLSS